MNATTLTKPELAALGRIFAREVSGHEIYQTSRSLAVRRLEALEESGHVVKQEITIPGRFTVTCKGRALTELGRMEYCQACG